MNRETLQTIGIPEDLSRSSAELLAGIAKFQDFDAQVTLFREGDQHPLLYWIKEGRVRLEMSRKHSGSKAVLTVGSGDLLAWSSLLGDGRMTSTAITTSPTTLIAFDASALRQLCEENHDIGYQVMLTMSKLISKRLVATRLQLLDLFHQESSQSSGGFNS